MKSIEAIISYRLQKSEDMLLSAEALVTVRQWDSVVNRLYYAAYHAVSALLYHVGEKAKTHSGLKNKFNELFIKTGKIRLHSAETYETLYSSRHDADYADFVIFEEEGYQTSDRRDKSIFKRS